MTPRLTPMDKLRVFWRTLFIQAGFNPRLMQTLGLLYALAPALRRLYPEPAAEQAAVRRHLSAFNTHPYVSAAIVGGVLHYEERVARGEVPPEQVARFKAAVMGPLAALGDGFFWLSLRPALGGLSIALVPLIGLWAVVVFMVLYNAVHLTGRAWMFNLGLTRGEGLIEGLGVAQIPKWGQRFRAVGAGCVGVVGTWLSVRFAAEVGGAESHWLGLGCLLSGVAAVALAQRRVSPLLLLYGMAGLAVLAGAVL